MTEQEWEIKTYTIATEMWQRLKYIAIYGDNHCFHPSNMELVEKWEKHMNEQVEKKNEQ